METRQVHPQLYRVNQRLKAGRIGVALIQKGNRLYLRATLPPRPGSSKTFSHQQEIALGIAATTEGIRTAEKEALKVGGLLAVNEFSWSPYVRDSKTAQPPTTIEDWVVALEADYFNRRARTAQSQTTWNTNYQEVFRRLPQERPLSIDVLKTAIASTQPDTRMRQKTCLALHKLSQFAGVEFDVKGFSGNYSPTQVTPRQIPSDELIIHWYPSIANPAWQWRFGMLATYGLRPHELFYLDLEDFQKGTGVLRVLSGGKTGSRRIWPLHPEWVEQFSLLDVKFSPCTGRTNKDLGQRVTQYFWRQDMPFRPYDLRHAWAIRSMEYGLEISLAAQQMGHSAIVHSQTYHAWLADRHHQQAFERLLARPGRPLPPQFDRGKDEG